MQIIATLGWVIWGLEVLPFAGSFGATQGLKQERGERNKDLSFVNFFFHGIQNPIQLPSLSGCSVDFDLQLQEVWEENRIQSDVHCKDGSMSVSQSEYLIKNNQTTFHSVFWLCFNDVF